MERRDDSDDDDKAGGWNDPAGAAAIEGEDRGPLGGHPFPEEDAGDDKPRDDEEDVDADVSAREPRNGGVEQDDQEDRHGAEPLDVGPERSVAGIGPGLVPRGGVAGNIDGHHAVCGAHRGAFLGRGIFGWRPLPDHSLPTLDLPSGTGIDVQVHTGCPRNEGPGTTRPSLAPLQHGDMPFRSAHRNVQGGSGGDPHLRSGHLASS